MNPTDRQVHWEAVYAAKAETDVSWFDETPAPSLELIGLVGATSRCAIIDIGGGAARLVDHLVCAGCAELTALDLSASMLAVAKARLGEKARQLHWRVADATTWEPSRTAEAPIKKTRRHGYRRSPTGSGPSGAARPLGASAGFPLTYCTAPSTCASSLS